MGTCGDCGRLWWDEHRCGEATTDELLKFIHNDLLDIAEDNANLSPALLARRSLEILERIQVRLRGGDRG